MSRRIMVNLVFVDSVEADEVWGKLKTYLQTKQIKKQVNETSYIEYQECLHETGDACTVIQRFQKE